MLPPWKKSYDKLSRDITLPTKKHHFANKGPSSQSYSFSSSHIWMWELDHKEKWAPKNWCFWTVVLEKILESPLDCKAINLSFLKEINPDLFIGRTDAEAEAPILWPPEVKSCLIGKDLDAGKDWGQEERWATEHEMVRWHHWFNRLMSSNCGREQRTEKPGMLQSMVSQSQRQFCNWTTIGRGKKEEGRWSQRTVDQNFRWELLFKVHLSAGWD